MSDTQKGIYNNVKEAVDTPQAHLYGVVFLVNIAVILLSFLLVPKMRTVGVLIGIVFAIPVALLSMYNIACLTKGHCNIWAWIIVSLMVIVMVSTIVRSVFGMVKK